MKRLNATAAKLGKTTSMLSFGLLSALSLTFLAGCGGSIVGHWHLTKAIPNREALAIDDARFNRDGTYTASVTLEGRTTREEGAYKFNGFRLIMHPNGGGQHRYDTFIRGRSLEVHHGERKLILKKGKREDGR